jgi:hypothetical protein
MFPETLTTRSPEPPIDIPESERNNWFGVLASDPVVEYLAKNLWDRPERPMIWEAARLAQAEATGRRVANEWTPVAVYSSPLSRSVKTAEAIAKHFNLPVQIHPGLADID